jgi:hypothetical protein
MLSVSHLGFQWCNRRHYKSPTAQQEKEETLGLLCNSGNSARSLVLELRHQYFGKLEMKLSRIHISSKNLRVLLVIMNLLYPEKSPQFERVHGEIGQGRV